jgi:uncharacterized protein YggT (Ycf19 family)
MTMTNAADATAREYEQRADEAERSPVPIFLKIGRAIVWVIYALVLLNAILLTLAFFLRLFGANPDAGFVEWVYRSTDRAMEPFRGIFPTHEIGDASVLDTSLLFAALFYFIVALLIDVAIRWLTRRLEAHERNAAQLRAQATWATQQAAAQHAVSEQAIREAAAREHAAQQAAAQQYAIAQAAARDAIAEHAAHVPPAPPPPPAPGAPPAPGGPKQPAPPPV